MRVFVTGATGFVGSAVVAELGRRGHQVIGLARSERAARALLQTGIGIHRGDVEVPESLTPILSEVDAVIHTAFNHDFSRYLENCEADRRLLDILAGALAGTDKALIATSATVVTETNDLMTEHKPASEQVPRSASEAFLHFADQGVRTAVVRLPPSVHGAGDTAFVPALIALARQHGVSAYIGEGSNRWPAVHRDDAACLFCDAVEQPRPGARYHAVAETGIPFRDIAEAIGEGLGLPVRSLPVEQAETHFGWLAMFAAIDNPTSSDWTRKMTGWASHQAGLIQDMPGARYFDPQTR